MKYDVIIIGAGVAGMTAAIYLRRAGKSVLVLEAKARGGQAIQTNSIQNYPGYNEITGAELMDKIYHQANNLGAKFEYGEVLSIKNAENEFIIETDEDSYRAEKVILAVGTESRKMGLENETKFEGNGISYCATCDGALYKGKKVVIAGGGNSALYSALYLADVAEKVYLIHYKKEFRGDEILVNELKKRQNVEIILDTEILDILGEEKVEGIRIKNSDGEKELATDGIFVMWGKVPATEKYRDLVKLDDGGFIVAGEDCKTSVNGIYVAGDCRTKRVRQIITAAADGAVAASVAIEEWKSY